MKEIELVKPEEGRVKPFIPHSFNQNEEIFSKIDFLETLQSKSSKQAIQKRAKKMGISYDKEKIRFARKILMTIADEIENGE